MRKVYEQEVIRFSRIVEQWIQENIFAEYTLDIRMDWSAKRRSCRGGMYARGPGINMAMRMLVVSKVPYRCHEYPSFDNDPVIGGFYSDKQFHRLQHLVLHEIAHSVQFLHYDKYNTRCKPHGPLFKHYYALLRKQFLNSQLPKNQTELKKLYYKPIENVRVSVQSV